MRSFNPVTPPLPCPDRVQWAWGTKWRGPLCISWAGTWAFVGAVPALSHGDPVSLCESGRNGVPRANKVLGGPGRASPPTVFQFSSARLSVCCESSSGASERLHREDIGMTGGAHGTQPHR